MSKLIVTGLLFQTGRPLVDTAGYENNPAALCVCEWYTHINFAQYIIIRSHGRSIEEAGVHLGGVLASRPFLIGSLKVAMRIFWTCTCMLTFRIMHLFSFDAWQSPFRNLVKMFRCRKVSSYRKSQNDVILEKLRITTWLSSWEAVRISVEKSSRRLLSPRWSRVCSSHCTLTWAREQ